MRLICHLFFHLLGGWRIRDERPPGLDRYIVVVAPHTSNWDFPVGLCVRKLAPMGDVKYLAKKELFKPPFGWLFRALGGYPVDRSKHSNMVDAVVDLFREGHISKIAITPEGTRKYQPNWKTGFHHIAMKAGVPIILGSFDYSRKIVDLSAPVDLSGDLDKDIETMKAYFRKRKGKYPEQGVL